MEECENQKNVSPDVREHGRLIYHLVYMHTKLRRFELSSSLPLEHMIEWEYSPGLGVSYATHFDDRRYIKERKPILEALVHNAQVFFSRKKKQ